MESEQIVVVETSAPGSFHAALRVFEIGNGNTIGIMGEVPVVIGKNGVTDGKTEGDGKSPAGIYELGGSFGVKAAPDGVALPYRQVTEHDYWIDDPHSDDYNQWVYYEGNASDRWGSFERLTHPLYTHAIIVKYNTDPVAKGKGSAIFIHQWESPDSPTAGCVAMSYENLVRLLKILDPQKNPKLIIS